MESEERAVEDRRVEERRADDMIGEKGERGGGNNMQKETK